MRRAHPEDDYLSHDRWVESCHPEIQRLVLRFGSAADAYHFVRDEIGHTYDVQGRTTPGTASEVLAAGHGLCFAKAHLLAAILRAMGIPSGLAYQRLLLGETLDEGYSLHGFNTIFDPERGSWVRLDARGNKNGIAAEYPVSEESLAFKVRPSVGEVDYLVNFAFPPRQIQDFYTGYAEDVDVFSRRLPESLDPV